jgi:ribosomal RNA-processing protein 1
MRLKLPPSRVYSIDKYYILVRKFVNASFCLLVREEWYSAACEEYNHMIGGPGGPL